MRPREMMAGPLLAMLAARRAIAGRDEPPGAFRILLLHDVPPNRRDRLARLLDHIARRGGFIAPDQALVHLGGVVRLGDDERGGPPCLLTFDDGFASNREVAERLLAPRGIKAVFFVCPGLIDLDPAARREAVAAAVFENPPLPSALPPDPLLMGWDDLAALAAAGHTIGSHALGHRRLTTLRGAALENEVGAAAARLKSRLGAAPEWFAYPFGDIDSIDSTALAVIARHHRICRSGVRGHNRPGANPLALFADNVDLDSSFAWQRLVVAGGLDGRYRGRRERLLAMAGTGTSAAA